MNRIIIALAISFAVVICFGNLLRAESTTQPMASAVKAWKLAVGPNEVATDKTVLHDKVRGKDLNVFIVYPKGNGPFPVIVFSHGCGAKGEGYLPLLQYWASHGYMILAPAHADSLSVQHLKPSQEGAAMGYEIQKLANDAEGWKNRAMDVKMVLDSFDDIQTSIPALKGKLDAKRIGVGGHSYGAHTSGLIGGVTVDNPHGETAVSYADPRPLAILQLSGQGTGTMGLVDNSWDHVTRPMMCMTGTFDRHPGGQGWEWKSMPFDRAPAGAKYNVNVDGADHMSFTLGNVQSLRTGKMRQPIDDEIMMYSMAFWDAYVKGDPDAKAWLDDDSRLAYCARVTRK